jgi:ribosomal protein L32
MSYSDKKLLRLGWDEARIKKGRQLCAKCGKQKMQHSVANGCPLPKKGIVQNYSQNSVFVTDEPDSKEVAR